MTAAHIYEMFLIFSIMLLRYSNPYHIAIILASFPCQCNNSPVVESPTGSLAIQVRIPVPTIHVGCFGKIFFFKEIIIASYDATTNPDLALLKPYLILGKLLYQSHT